MIDEITTEEVIENSQDDMNDFMSFEDADHSVEEGETNDNIEEAEEVKEDKESKEAKPEDKEVKEVSSSDKPEQKELLDPKEIKTLAIQNGDDKSEIRMDATVSMKVDGKDVEMTMQEVVNAASGNQAVDKRFSELSTEKSLFKGEQASFNVERDDLVNKISSFSDAVQKNDAVGAINALALLSGSNPVELRHNFKNLLLEQAKAYIEMSPEQQVLFDNQQEVEYHRQESESLRSQNESQQSNVELENSLLRFQAKHGVNDAALVVLYDEAEAKSVELNNAEDFERFHSGQLTQTRSSELLSSVDPSLSSNEEALSIVSDYITKNPGISDEDVVDIIKQTLDDENSETSDKENSLSNKIQKKQKKNLKGKQSDNNSQVPEDDDDEMLTFDDLGY